MTAGANQQAFEVYDVESGKTKRTNRIPAAVRAALAEPGVKEVHDIRASPARIYRPIVSGGRDA